MQRALETLQSNLENDTDIAAAELDLMERTTVASTFKYQLANEQLEATVAGADELSSAKAEAEAASSALDALEEHAEWVEALVEELDQWVSELEVKARRLGAK